MLAALCSRSVFIEQTELLWLLCLLSGALLLQDRRGRSRSRSSRSGAGLLCLLNGARPAKFFCFFMARVGFFRRRYFKFYATGGE